jgi:SprT-like family
MQVESAVAPLPAEQVYARVFRRMKPRTPLPAIEVQFRRYANANAQIKLAEGTLLVKMADTLAGAPESVHEALAEILLSKLFRRPVPASSNDRYRRYLNSRDVRRSLDLVRQIRGRKRVEHPRGRHYDLERMFEELNFRYFFGLMARPALGWSPQAARTMLGHYDPSHNAIVLSRILDRAETPRLAVEYVLFHEMLHLRYPAEHQGARRCVHTRAFKDAEKQFEGLKEAKALLRKL